MPRCLLCIQSGQSLTGSIRCGWDLGCCLHRAVGRRSTKDSGPDLHCSGHTAICCESWEPACSSRSDPSLLCSRRALRYASGPTSSQPVGLPKSLLDSDGPYSRCEAIVPSPKPRSSISKPGKSDPWAQWLQGKCKPNHWSTDQTSSHKGC